MTMDKDIIDNCAVILDASAPDFAEQFREAISAAPGDTIEITTPQFTRTDGIVVPSPQINFNDLHKMPRETLIQAGLLPWDEPNEKGEVLWLIPGEWYDRIPEGFMLMCISGETEPFERGKTDDDTRFGCLAYGVICKH